MTNPTTYYRPTTLEEALAYAAQPGSIALAGGALSFTGVLLDYQTVVDLQGIAALTTLAEAGEDSVAIGGAVTLQAVVESPLVPNAVKRSLLRAVPLNIRNGATVGESLSVPQPPREWLAALVALNVGVERVSVAGEHRLVAIGDLLDTFGQPRRDIITQVYIPLLRQREALGAAFVARTPADAPIVNAAVHVRLADDGTVTTATVGLCGASAQPVARLELTSLLGNPLDEANIASAVKAVAPAVEPVADYRGSADYRREMARVTTQRALLDALAQLSV